MFLITE